MTQLIYLDYAATTPLDARVLARMQQHMTVGYANPSAHLYSAGREAARAVEEARQQVADVIGAAPREIIWTSGATEANNLAILGAARFYEGRGRHLISTAIEHSSVLEPLEQLARQGYDITWIDPDRTGRVNPESVIGAMREDTILVSVMHANNETGRIQPIEPIGEVTRKAGILLHCDAAQTAGRMAVDVNRLHVDLLSLSAHKHYGPKGIGALYVRGRPRVMLEPLTHGGGQERGMRPGTLPVHQIVGMAEALRLAESERRTETSRLRELRDRLWQGLQAIPGIRCLSDMTDGETGNLCHILMVQIPDWPAEKLAERVPGLCFSSGAACDSSRVGPSRVLMAMGCSTAQAIAPRPGEFFVRR